MFVVRPGQGRIGSQVSHRRTPRLHIVAEMGRAAGVQGGKISRDEILALPSAKGSVSTYDATWPTASRRPRWSVTRPPARSQRRPRWSVTRPPARSQRRPSLATRPAIRPEPAAALAGHPAGHPAGAAATPAGCSDRPSGRSSGDPHWPPDRPTARLRQRRPRWSVTGHLARAAATPAGHPTGQRREPAAISSARPAGLAPPGRRARGER